MAFVGAPAALRQRSSPLPPLASRGRPPRQRRFPFPPRRATAVVLCSVPSPPPPSSSSAPPPTAEAKVVGVWDNLTRGDLDRAVAAGTLRLALVGMSNCGKSHRSSELVTAGHQARVVVGGHQAGALDPGSDGRRGGSDGVTQGVFPAAPEAAPFSRFCVDDKIEVELEQELSLAGLTGIEGLATWMGTPADDHFWAAQARYLELEEGITANAIRSLAAGGGGGGRGLSVRSAAGSAGAEAEKPTNVVLDTTGSVVYLSAATRQALMTTYFVVHLVASDGMLAEMTEGYFATPKPVVWGPREGGVWDGIREGDADGVAALRRCYPALLAQRRQRYGTLAHVAVPAEVARDPAVDGDAFWAAIREQLPDDRGDGRGGVVFGRFGG